MEISTSNGRTLKHKKSGTISKYCHESKMNQTVNRQPSRCKIIYNRLSFAKTGGTLVPMIMQMNSNTHRAIIV